MIYLASPYSHNNPAIEEARFRMTRVYVAGKVKQGLALFSPIVYCHQFAREFGYPGDAKFWLDFNTRMMKAASMVEVLQLDGWRNSRGVAFEIDFAKELNIPVTFVEFNP